MQLTRSIAFLQSLIRCEEAAWKLYEQVLEHPARSTSKRNLARELRDNHRRTHLLLKEKWLEINPSGAANGETTSAFSNDPMKVVAESSHPLDDPMTLRALGAEEQRCLVSYETATKAGFFWKDLQELASQKLLPNARERLERWTRAATLD